MSLTEVARPQLGFLRRGRRDVPSFAGLAWTKANGSEREFLDQLALFEADQGRMIDSYWCTTTVGGVALTEKRPPWLLRRLGWGSETRLHRMTENMVRYEPKFARLLLQSDRQAIRASNVLSGMSRRIALFTLFASTRQILTFLEGYLERRGNADPEDVKERARLEREWTETLRVHERIQADFLKYYDDAAARQAQIVYLVGMLRGFVLLVLAVIGLAALFTTVDVPGVDRTTFLGCLIAGGIGAVVSVLMRMNADKFTVNHEIGREYLSRLGAFRPAIGGVFALLMYFALQGNLLPNIEVPSDQPSEEFAWFLAVGFLLGFSERFAKEMIGRAEGGVGLGSEGQLPPPGVPAVPEPHEVPFEVEAPPRARAPRRSRPRSDDDPR